MIKLFPFSFFLFLYTHLIAQSIIPRFENLSTNDGMPHSSVYSITQDKIGFMWFGTADGLCRYDGNLLKVFKYESANSDDVINNFVRGKIVEDQSGNIWYSNESGIFKWDCLSEKVKKEKIFDNVHFQNTTFQSVAIDQENSLWLFNLTYGIFEFNIRNRKFTRYPIPYPIERTSIALRFIQADLEGNIWIRVGNEESPFFKFNQRQKSYSKEFVSHPPHAIFFCGTERILAYDDKLIIENRLSSRKETVLKRKEDELIKFYSFEGISDQYRRIWMTSRGNGLFYFDEKQKDFHQFNHNNGKLKSLPFDYTTCLFIDRNENLWIGIDGGGVAKLDLKQPKFNLFPLSEGDFPELKDYFTKCFFEDDKGRIWFGSQTQGLNIFHPETRKMMNFHYDVKHSKSIPGNMVGAIFKDKENNMWIGSSGGISIFNENKGSFKTITITELPKLYPDINNFVYRIIQLQNGKLLAATLQGIILITKDTKGNFAGQYFKDFPYLKSTATDLVEMADQSIFASIPYLGLYHLIPTQNGFSLANKYLEGIDLRSVRQDEQNADYLWIGSGKGLIHFNTLTKKHQLWNEKNGINNSYVYGALEDVKGNLWISTNKGLSNFDISKNTFQNFTFLDGLQSNEFNTQSFYKSTTGNLYFGGLKGFNWFNPNVNNQKRENPVAVVTHIEINEKAFHKDSLYLRYAQLSTDYNENDFYFQFGVLDFTRPEANKLQFKLEGWDKSWINCENRSARYSNLPHGEYTLRLKAANANGIWGAEEKIKIIIKGPFWKKTGFLIGAALIALLAAVYISYLFTKMRTAKSMRILEQQIAVEAERIRISADMHDEIGSGITHIALLSELIQTQQKKGNALQTDIKIIAQSARTLVSTMSEIIWSLNAQNDTLDSLLAYIRAQTHQYFEALNVNFEINFPAAIPAIKLSNEQRRNLYLVTREASNNAMKHAQAQTIQLQVVYQKNQICFSIIDDGLGMKQTAQFSHGNGIKNMKKRMSDIGGNIEWIKLEKGTRVNYCLSL